MSGRHDDDPDEAMAHLADRDPSLWRILHTMQKKLDRVTIGGAALLLLVASGNPWVAKLIELFGPLAAAAAGSHGMAGK